MSDLNNIEASQDTLMTEELIRIFKSAGCSPTWCHACDTEIKAGEIFKLVPHPKTDANGNELDDIIDEMCCDRCETIDLKLRDSRRRLENKEHRARKIASGGHGFSRPSKAT